MPRASERRAIVVMAMAPLACPGIFPRAGSRSILGAPSTIVAHRKTLAAPQWLLHFGVAAFAIAE